LIDKGGFAMIDVGDDGDIAQALDGHGIAKSGQRTPVRKQHRRGAGEGETDYYTTSTAPPGVLET